MASRSRTGSDTPSHTNWQSPSGARSTRRTTHSASRITTRALGADAEPALEAAKSGGPRRDRAAVRRRYLRRGWLLRLDSNQQPSG